MGGAVDQADRDVDAAGRRRRLPEVLVGPLAPACMQNSERLDGVGVLRRPPASARGTSRLRPSAMPAASTARPWSPSSENVIGAASPAAIVSSWVAFGLNPEKANGWCCTVSQPLAWLVRTVSVTYSQPSPAGVRDRSATHGSGVAPAPVHAAASSAVAEHLQGRLVGAGGQRRAVHRERDHQRIGDGRRGCGDLHRLAGDVEAGRRRRGAALGDGHGAALRCCHGRDERIARIWSGGAVIRGQRSAGGDRPGRGVAILHLVGDRRGGRVARHVNRGHVIGTRPCRRGVERGAVGDVAVARRDARSRRARRCTRSRRIASSPSGVGRAIVRRGHGRGGRVVGDEEGEGGAAHRC